MESIELQPIQLNTLIHIHTNQLVKFFESIIQNTNESIIQIP
jgi:hypothetical protein